MAPPWDTLSRSSKRAATGSYSPLFCRSRKSVSVSWRDGPLSANSIFTPTPPTQKQYGFVTVCKKRAMRSFRGSALSKAIPLTSGRDSAATAPMSTLFICSSSCVVNLTISLLCRLIKRIPLLFGGETQQASTAGMLACCLTPPWDTLSQSECILILIDWGTPHTFSWPVQRQQYSVRRSPRKGKGKPGEGRRPACPVADRGRGMASPLAALVLFAHSLLKKSPRTRRPAPRTMLGAAAVPLR